MRTLLSVAAIVGALLAVTGCTAEPSREDLTRYFSVELAAGAGEPEDWVELAELLADDALDGKCGSDLYTSSLGDDPVMRYAWAAICTGDFEHDMTEAQFEAATDVIVGFTVAQIEDQTDSPQESNVEAEPEIEPSETLTPIAPLAADDPARVGLDAKFDVLFADESYKSLRDQYCTMTDDVLLATGDVFAKTIRDVTPEKFLAYIAERCGR